MIRLYTFLIIIFITYPTFGQVTLVGKWKPIKASFISSDNKIKTIYDIGNRKMKNRAILANYDSTKFLLNQDSTFHMASFGLILPLYEPGWSFGNKFEGKWTINSSANLKLTIGDNEINHSFFYKIISCTIDSLILGQTNDDYEEVYMKIEFVHL